MATIKILDDADPLHDRTSGVHDPQPELGTCGLNSPNLMGDAEQDGERNVDFLVADEPLPRIDADRVEAAQRTAYLQWLVSAIRRTPRTISVTTEIRTDQMSTP